jgi:hypothetical protein
VPPLRRHGRRHHAVRRRLQRRVPVLVEAGELRVGSS